MPTEESVPALSSVTLLFANTILSLLVVMLVTPCATEIVSLSAVLVTVTFCPLETLVWAKALIEKLEAITRVKIDEEAFSEINALEDFAPVVEDADI